MKPLNSKIWLVLAIFIFSLKTADSQVPQGFNYQAIARDGSGNPIINYTLQVKLAVMADSAGNTIYWEELFDPVITNAYGLFTVIMGRGVRQSSSTVATFSLVNWKVTPVFMRAKIYYQSAWKDMGSTRLWSVPYALVSNGIGCAIPYLSIAGTTTTMDSALFAVRNNIGQIIFAVYNEGVRIYVDNGTKGSTKGGFAIGGFGTGKGVSQEYLRVTSDSTRIYVKNQGKETFKGGFAIGGFDGSKAPTWNYLDLTPKNYFIGHQTGIFATGLYNSVLGYKAARNLSTGYQNTIIGHLADSALTTGFNNIVIGEGAGFTMSTGDNNTLIGTGAGHWHTNQEFNVMIGTAAGNHINASGWAGSFNTFMGINAGSAIQSSRDNTFLGTNAGYWLENGQGNTFVGIDAGRAGNDRIWAPGSNYAYYNTFIGTQSGRNIVNGSNNVAIGYQSGFTNTGGSGNVFIGYSAGYSETGSNKLYIANASSNPLIYGDFTGKKLGVNTSSLNKTLNVGGDADINGTLTATNVSAPVTGDLTGNVNGLTMGKVFLTADGNIVSTNGGAFALNWNFTNNWIEIINTSSTVKCSYWYRMQSGASITGNSAFVNASANSKIIISPDTDYNGLEIHFGQADGTAGWCSVWLQYYHGTLVGHYIRY